jgi:hypothetical protein
MAEIGKLERDLAYVGQALRRADGHRPPMPIYFLWAAIGLVGFALVDFATGKTVGVYWAVAAPLGTLISAVLGRWYSRREGQVDRQAGIRQALHWTAMMAAIFLTALMALKGSLTWRGVSQTAVLILALGYFLAGVHLEPRLRWVGLLMAGGYLATLFFSGLVWTFVGALVAVGLIASALLGDRKHAVTA